VIPEKRVDAPSIAGRIALEAAEQIKRASRISTPIDHVARLHKDRPSSSPTFAGVDETGRPENGDKSIVRTVYVSDCHDAFLGCDGTRIGNRLRSSRGCGKTRRDYRRGRERLLSHL
jgi:hypothetical protein